MSLFTSGRILAFRQSFSQLQRSCTKSQLLDPITLQSGAKQTAYSTNRSAHYYINLKRKSFKLTDLKEHSNMASEGKVWPRICLFGDSITRRSMDPNNGCWGSMVAYKTNDLFDVHVRGFEGYNTRMALELMPELFPKHYLDSTEIMVIFFGHNDEWESSPLGVPVDEYDRNLNGIIDYLIGNGFDSKKVILITPSWYHKPDFDVFMKESGFPPTGKQLANCEKYSDVVKAVGRNKSIQVLDFFTTSINHKPLEELFCDGVHFSKKGAEVLYSQLMPIIEQKVHERYGKDLKDIKHVTPCELRPEIMAAIMEYRKSQGL